MSCHICKQNIGENSCPRCSRLICDECSYLCEECSEYVCYICVDKCGYKYCTEDLCTICCDKKYCYICNYRIYHHDESNLCDFCENPFCLKDRSEWKCFKCGKYGCKKCVKDREVYLGHSYGWVMEMCCESCYQNYKNYY